MPWSLEFIIGGGLIILVSFIMANNRAQDKKIDRAYERLDHTKNYQDSTFTRKDICAERHEQMRRDLVEIKADVKLILKQGSGAQGIQGVQGRDGRNGKDA